MRLAVISDVHGNALALEAVLADIAREGVDALLNLGDHVYGPGDPGAVAERLMGLDMVAISGNTDRTLVEIAPQALDEGDRAILGALPDDARAWLKRLPKTAVYADAIFLCHGTPASDEVYWLDRRDETGHFRRAAEAEIRAELPTVDLPVYCCGHTHVARVVTLSDGRIVFNPGSVGRPTFAMYDPESAARLSPDAAYALVTNEGGRWTVALRQVPYNHAEAARIAREEWGMKKWARDLAEGRKR